MAVRGSYFPFKNTDQVQIHQDHRPGTLDGAGTRNVRKHRAGIPYSVQMLEQLITNLIESILGVEDGWILFLDGLQGSSHDDAKPQRNHKSMINSHSEQEGKMKDSAPATAGEARDDESVT
jgi:hypothetical protein